MKDINRIDIIINKLQTIWKKNPDMRFFQLLNAIWFNSNKDWFYLEDNVLEEQLNKYETK